VLNDNEMSIAPNVGAMHKYLTSIQRNPLYNRVRSKIGDIVDNAGAVGTIVRKWEESMKSFLTPGVLFEELGFRYFGPIDGHDIDALIDTFAAVREMGGPRLVHVITQKGKDFPAGEHATGEKWHALPPGHDPSTGKQLKTSAANPAYTAVFGKGLADLGTENKKVVTITGSDAERHWRRGVRQGASVAVLRRRHRGRTRRHLCGWSHDARTASSGRDLFDIPAARLRQHHPRLRDSVAARGVRDGSRWRRR
jgi:deoxyxylulose-5-phosphate synthase